MLKRFVVLMAAMSFVAACAKKSDDNSAVAAAAPTNPVPANSAPSAPGPATDGSQAGTLGQNVTSGGASSPDIVLNEQYSGAADDPMNQYQQ